MVNKSKRNKVLTGIVLAIFLIQIFSILDLGLGQEELDNEDDLEFHILGNMNVTNNEFTGSGDMGIGTYTIQDAGTYNRWYKEPTITNGDFSLNNLRFELDEINEPYYDETTPNFFNVSNYTGTIEHNSTEINEYPVANDKITQLKVNLDYNMSYQENNVTSIEDTFGTTTGNLNSLNDTDGDIYNVKSNFEFAQRYNISDVDMLVGTKSGNVDDLQDPFISTKMTLNSYAYTTDKFYAGGGTSSGGLYGQWHHTDIDPYFLWLVDGGIPPAMPPYYDHADLSDYGGGVNSIFFQNWNGYASYMYASANYVCITGVPQSDYYKYNRMIVGVRYRVKFDNHDVLSSETYEGYLQYYNALTSSWDTQDTVTMTGSPNTWCSWRYIQKSFYGSDIRKYLDTNGYVHFRCLLYAVGSHSFLPEALNCYLEVDYDYVSFKARHEISAKLESENVIDYSRVEMMANSLSSFRIYTPGTTDHWNSIGFYNNYFETSVPNSLHYIYVYGQHESSFSIEIYYVAIYDKREYQKANQTFDFNFTGQDAINNEYNISIRYKASNENIWELSFGNEFLEQDYELISTLDSTDWITEEFQFTSIQIPRINLFLQQSTYDYLTQNYLEIEIDEINITAIYMPISEIKVINFNYTYGVDTYTENFTLGFNKIEILNATHGNLSYIFSSEDFSIYDPLVPKAFVIPEQNLTLNFTFPFNITHFNASISVHYSGVEWISSTEAGLQLNGYDVLPTSPYEAYLELLSYPNSITYTAETEEVRFKTTALINFDFSSDLEIISRRVLKRDFKLSSDHPIYIESIEFDTDLELYSAWLDGFAYEIIDNKIYPGITMLPGETFLLEIYLQDDIYKELQTYFSNLGSGTYSLYLSGTTNSYFYDDVSISDSFFTQLPQYFGVQNMDVLISDIQYIEDYTSDPNQNIFDNYYEPSEWENAESNWHHQYYSTGLNATKLYETGGSDNVIHYQNNFTDWTNEMEIEHFPDNESSMSIAEMNYLYKRTLEEFSSDWDFSTGSYDCYAITNNGTHYFISDTNPGTEQIGVYDLDGNLEFKFDADNDGGGGGSGYMGMDFVNGTLRIIQDNGRIFEYGIDGTYYGYITIDTALAFENSLCWDGDYYWISETWSSLCKMYKFDGNGVYQSVVYDLSGSINNIDGCDFNGTHFFVVDAGGITDYLRIFDTSWNLVNSYAISNHPNGVTYDAENFRLLTIHNSPSDIAEVYEPNNYTTDGLYMQNVNPNIEYDIAGNNSGYFNYSLNPGVNMTSNFDNSFIDAYNNLPETYQKDANYSIAINYNLTATNGNGTETEWIFNETSSNLYPNPSSNAYVIVNVEEYNYIFSYYYPSRAYKFDLEWNYIDYTNVLYTNTRRSYGGDYNGSVIALIDNWITDSETIDFYDTDWNYIGASPVITNPLNGYWTPRGICWNPDNLSWYILFYTSGDAKVVQYDQHFVEQYIYDIPALDGSDQAWNLEYYDGRFYAGNRNGDLIVEYDTSFNLITTHTGIGYSANSLLTGLAIYERNNGTHDQMFLGILDWYPGTYTYVNQYRIQEIVYHPNATINGENLVIDGEYHLYYKEYSEVSQIPDNITINLAYVELELAYLHISNITYIYKFLNGTNGIYQRLTITPELERNDYSGDSDQLYLNMSMSLGSDGGSPPGESYPFEFNQTFDISSQFSSGYIEDIACNGTHFVVFNFLSPSDHDAYVFDLNGNYIKKYDLASVPGFPNYQPTAWIWDATNLRWLFTYGGGVFDFNWDFTSSSGIIHNLGYGNVFGFDEYNGNYYICHRTGSSTLYLRNYTSTWSLVSTINIDSYMPGDTPYDLEVFNNSYWVANYQDDVVLVMNFTDDIGQMYANELDPGTDVVRIALLDFGEESYLYIDRSNQITSQIFDQFKVIEEYSTNWNGFNHSVFSYRINITTEDGILSLTYSSDVSFTQFYHWNISQILLDNGKEKFYNFTFEFFIGGNPTNFTLENITLYEYDSEFEDFTSIWINDDYAVQNEPIILYFNYTENNPSHLIVNQSFIGVLDPNVSMHQIDNYSLTDDYPGVLNSYVLSNYSTGYYELNLTFYDLGGNYEIWYVNYTLISLVSISASFQNPVLVNQSNEVSVSIISDYPIIQIHYDNSTDYVLEYDNSSYPISYYEFNFSISYPIRTIYNISIDAITENNDTFCLNISNLYCIEKITYFDIQNLHSDYDQADQINLTIQLKDHYNLPVINEIVNSSLIAPNGTTIISQLNTTNIDGEFYFNFTTGEFWDAGFYHINCSFNGSDDYYGSWKYMSFELIPIVKEISNASDIDFTINGEDVINNTWHIVDLDASSFYLNIDHLGTATFDLLMDNVSLWFELDIDYSGIVEYDFIFNRYNSKFESIVVDNIYLYDIPDNFTYYYYNNFQNTKYAHILHNDTLYPEQPIGKTYENQDEFLIELRYIENAVRRTQITEIPTTNIDSVLFEQDFIADLDYRYWYFTIEDQLNGINSLTHRRTAQQITEFTTQNNSYYFSLAQKTEVNDIFDAVLDLDPGWDVEYTLVDNGTFATLTIDYKADFVIENVSIILDLETDGTFHESWTNGTQTDDFVFTLTNITFTPISQQIIINGTSSIPYAAITQFESDQTFNRIVVGSVIDFAATLSYFRFSTLYHILKEPSWELINVYYGTQIIPVQTLTTNIGSFESSGFSPAITNSYIHFTETPFKSVNWDFNDQTSIITITINCSLDVQNVYFFYNFDPSGAHTLSVLSSSNDFEVLGLTDSGDWDGYLYFYSTEIKDGITIIEIYVNFATPAEMWVQAIFVFIVGGIIVGVYYYLKHNEKKLEKVRSFVQEKIIDKISKEKEQKGYSELKIQIKDNKILLEVPKDKKS